MNWQYMYFHEWCLLVNFLFESVLLATLKSDIWQSLSCLETLIAYRKRHFAHPIQFAVRT